MTRLTPTTAERLSRLRLLLNDAQSRVGDQSPLGTHLAVISLDGVCELAIGLALHERSLGRGNNVLDSVGRLRNDLGPPWAAAGLQGFRELHASRNLAQHQGVVPDSNHLARWSAEAEAFVRDLVGTVFGVDLTEVSSAHGISDAHLRELLRDAERALDAGDAATSFSLSWDALEAARHAWARSGSRATVRAPSSEAFRRWSEFREIRDALEELSQRLEVGIFAPQISEWVWLRDQHAESRSGAPPTIDDARRALVFVTGWVLRFESYVARYPAERWRNWRDEQTAPRTGLPGEGPRIVDAELEDDGRDSDAMVDWRFQLADLPTSDDEFWSALSTSSYESAVESVVSMNLGPRGELSVRAPRDMAPREILTVVQSRLARAGQIVKEREHRLEERAAKAESLAEPYRAAFGRATEEGAPFGDVRVILRDDTHASPTDTRVSVALVDEKYEESVELWNHLADVSRERGFQEGGFTAFGDALVFPINWPADEAVAWALEGLARAEHTRQEKESKRSAEERAREAAQREMRELLEGDNDTSEGGS